MTTREVSGRRSASSHHNLLRFALKCLPPAAAMRVVVGELLRLPKHPRAIAGGIFAAAREWREIGAERRRIKPSADLFDWMLAGQPA